MKKFQWQNLKNTEEYCTRNNFFTNPIIELTSISCILLFINCIEECFTNQVKHRHTSSQSSILSFLKEPTQYSNSNTINQISYPTMFNFTCAFGFFHVSFFQVFRHLEKQSVQKDWNRPLRLGKCFPLCENRSCKKFYKKTKKIELIRYFLLIK